MPLLPFIEVFGIFLPLAFHAGYGVKLALEGRPNVGRYPFSRNWLYTFQRVTGLVAFAFIAWHLWEFRIAKLTGKMTIDAFYPTLALHLSSTYGGVPVLALVYLVGIAASTFHFANGLATFAFGWGICVSRRSQRTLGALLAVGGFILFLVGADTALFFATGARFPGLSESSSSPTDRCSVVDPGSVKTSIPSPLEPRQQRMR
jgi:succinate dehydrogenase / fumarate reductase cytochrome b subunit